MDFKRETYDYSARFKASIDRLKQEGRYRVFHNLGRRVGDYPEADLYHGSKTDQITVWCSNDYLGMGHHPEVCQAMCQAINDFGAGAGGTRNISGTHKLIVELEQELADLHQKEAALLFTSGFVANETALSTLGRILPNCVIYSDANNHASMIEGIRHSGAEKHVFAHNNPADLERLLQQAPVGAPKLVVFESIYSMEGDIAPIREIVTVAKKYGALTFIDETHAVGVYGAQGGGIVEREGLLSEVDFLQGGLGKGYGVVGGFVTGSAAAIDAIRSYGTGFIFTTALPPAVAAGALAAVRYLRRSQREREALYAYVHQLKSMLNAAGIPVMPGAGHMIPVLVGDSAACKEVSDYLLNQHQIYIQPINYPTVPRGTERLRITPSPAHGLAEMRKLVGALQLAWERFALRQAA